MKRPASLVASSVRELVSWLTTMTVAPGTTALVGSVTAPVMVAEQICAGARAAQTSVQQEHERAAPTMQ